MRAGSRKQNRSSLHPTFAADAWLAVVDRKAPQQENRMINPCPFCACKHSTVNNGYTYCADTLCNFHCPNEFWDSLPRMRWVSVEDRLPEGRAGSFLVKCKDDNILFGRKNWARFFDGYAMIEGVTHWLDGVSEVPSECPPPTGAPNG